MMLVVTALRVLNQLVDIIIQMKLIKYLTYEHKSKCGQYKTLYLSNIIFIWDCLHNLDICDYSFFYYCNNKLIERVTTRLVTPKIIF